MARSSHQRCSVRKSVLRNFTNFIKKETLAQVFSCELCEISKNTFLQNTYGRLLLNGYIPHRDFQNKKYSELKNQITISF